MNVFDIFSGIGGFSLGFERAGMQTVAFCEIDPFCREIISGQWPSVPVWEDIRHLRRVPLPRPLGWRQEDWPVGAEERIGLRPDWVVIENVGHTWRRWVPELRRELWDAGYSSLPLRVRASDLGAPHERSRIFLVAHTDSKLLRELQGWWRRAGREMAAELARSWDFAPRGLGADDGLPNWVDRRRVLGNAVVPQIAELVGRAIMKFGA